MLLEMFFLNMFCLFVLYTVYIIHIFCMNIIRTFNWKSWGVPVLTPLDCFPCQWPFSVTYKYYAEIYSPQCKEQRSNLQRVSVTSYNKFLLQSIFHSGFVLLSCPAGILAQSKISEKKYRRNATVSSSAH